MAKPGSGRIQSVDQLDLGSDGVSIFSGTGPPGDTMATGQPPDVGDIYIRKDGVGRGYLYRCTAVGPPAVWWGVV